MAVPPDKTALGKPDRSKVSKALVRLGYRGKVTKKRYARNSVKRGRDTPIGNTDLLNKKTRKNFYFFEKSLAMD